MNFISNFTVFSDINLSLDTARSFFGSSSEAPLQKPRIQWRSCHDLDLGVDEDDLLFPIQCIKISVPLDYTNSSNTETIDLQLLRVSAAKQPSLGSVIINPGGPGESGCDYLALRASRFHAILDGRFDLVSFDPRGTGETRPFSCAYTPKAVLQSDTPKLFQRRLENVLDEKWESYKIAADECFETELENGRYMSTAFAARDILQIVDGLGEDGLLRYWGSSYGTVLGMTFASMFPDRVDRMLLDATVNPHDYMAGTSLQMLLDADKAFDAFVNECITFPEQCSLTELATTPDQLTTQINTMLQKVLTTHNSTHLYREIKNDMLYRGLYWPQHWSTLASQLKSFVSGDFSSLNTTPPSSPDDTASPPFEYNRGSAAVFGTRCADSSLRAQSPGDLADLLLQQQEVSSFADVNTATSLVCAAWNITPAERYEGNFIAKTRFPVLFVNGEFDPAAPVASARNASWGFEGSRVLVHGGYGHGLGAHPNMCVGRAVRRYFVRGELPGHEGEGKEGKCEREVGAFEIDGRMWQNNLELLEI